MKNNLFITNWVKALLIVLPLENSPKPTPFFLFFRDLKKLKSSYEDSFCC